MVMNILLYEDAIHSLSTYSSLSVIVIAPQRADGKNYPVLSLGNQQADRITEKLHTKWTYGRNDSGGGTVAAWSSRAN